MARKETDGKAGAANRLGLKVVGKQNGAPGTPEVPVVKPETIFAEMRTGRDRREQLAEVAEDSRRRASERRKGNVKQTSWWLERDYVESHHFVQKSSSSRGRRPSEDKSEE